MVTRSGSSWLYYLRSLPALATGIQNWPEIAAHALGWRRAEVFPVKLRGGLCLQARMLLDVWIIKEVCLDREYEAASIPLEDGWTIVDIGAGIGEFALGAAVRLPNARIYALEPSPRAFALLQANIAANQPANIVPLALAVAGAPGTLYLDVSDPDTVRHCSAGTGARTAIEVSATTLDGLFEQLAIERCHFLKIDCEGGEYALLFNTSPLTLRRIEHICLEFHEGPTRYGRGDLIDFFGAADFEVALRQNPVHPNTGLMHAWPRELRSAGGA